MNIKYINSKNNKLRNCTLKYIFILLSLFAFSNIKAQSDSSLFSAKYPFIIDSLNIVNNDSISLPNFYSKLLLLKNGDSTKLVIAHIGDSHIQADMFSGKIRKQLQKQFGNAGRGLIFPYRVAKTNGPDDYRSRTNTTWDIKRIISTSNPLPIGICGITIKTNCDSSFVHIRTNCDNMDYRFNTVKIFSEQNAENYDLLIKDTTGKSLGFLKSSKYLGDYRMSKINLDTLINEVVFQSVKIDSFQTTTQLYGFLLENNRAGVQYNTIGINGAEFSHFNEAAYFQEQLSYTKPDLLIISLGTNDSFHDRFDSIAFRNQVMCLISNLRLFNPNVEILIMTPPDSFKKRRYKNKNLLQVVEILTDICTLENIAYWNLFNIMGGSGSVAKWQVKKLAQRDRVHYTLSGYELQADMFYNALMNGFIKFENRH
ncbi:MAG: GDSL-type esterase/lipase family protein [Bacteroidota bacterium]